MPEFINQTAWQGERGFSAAVRVEPGKTWLLLSGVGSEGADGSASAPGDIAAQCRAAWASVRDVLASQGASVRDIVRVRAYVTDPRYLSTVTAARKEAFGGPPYPLHTFLVVSQLALPEMLVEIEVDAVI